MTETAAADSSDDIDEIVQVTNSNLSRLERPPPDANTSPNSISSAAAIMDKSTGHGFTTAPATSDEDDVSDEDDDEEDDSRSNYSISNHTTNTNSNMSVMTNGSGGGRAARHYGRLSSGSSGSQGVCVKGEEKRSHHNVLERKRRDLLKDSFARLRDSVPTTQPRERVSRAEILRQAADFIASTVQKNASVRAELDELIRKNREIEEKRAREGNSATAATSSTSTSGTSKVDQSETTIKQESS